MSPLARANTFSVMLDLPENVDLNGCYATFLEYLARYLDSYEECKDNYYFVFYDGEVSRDDVASPRQKSYVR